MFHKKGKVVWQLCKPYTLREAIVNTNGIIVGVGYQRGQAQEDIRNCAHLVIIDKDGNDILDEIWQRSPSEMMAFPGLSDFPYVRQIKCDDKGNFLLARFVEEGADRTFVSLIRIYELQTGKLIHVFNEKDIAPDPMSFIVDVGLIHDQPLVLVHWFRRELHRPGVKGSGTFTIVSFDSATHWTLNANRDYGTQDECSFRTSPAILCETESPRFRIHLFAANRDTAYEVVKLNNKWNVREFPPHGSSD